MLIVSFDGGVTYLLNFVIRLMFLFVINCFIDELQWCSSPPRMAA